MKNKRDLQIEQQIIYNLVQILESFPQYTLSQHLWHTLRSKGTEKEPYFWDNLTLLSKIEAYNNELNTELVYDTESDEGC
jgi:hypothetical protein